jgi:hypothetical protein
MRDRTRFSIENVAFDRRNTMCEFATVAHARPGIGAEILQSGKIWLEFMQQVERICQEAAENCVTESRSRNRLRRR